MEGQCKYLTQTERETGSEQEAVSCVRSGAVAPRDAASDLVPCSSKQQAAKPDCGHPVMEESGGHMPLTEPKRQAQESQDQEILIELQPIPFHQNPFVVANRKGRGRSRDARAAGVAPRGARGCTRRSVQGSSSEPPASNSVPREFCSSPTSEPDFFAPRTIKPRASNQVPSPSGLDSPEQRSFRDRQKYFEIDVKQQVTEKPKRVSLVAEDDLRKMKEEEERKMRHRPQDVLLDEDEEDEDEDKRISDISSQGTVVIEGVEYKIERVDGRSPESPSAGGSRVDVWREQRIAARDRIASEESRPNSITRLSPAFLESAAPIRTAKAERRYQERLRVQSPDLPMGRDKEMSPAERRALEAEKRAMWRAARHQALEDDLKQYEQDRARRLYLSRQRAAERAGPGLGTSVKHLPLARHEPPYSDFRMKSLEQDALKAQMVIAKSKEPKKRSPLDQLSESPSPAATPSPTPLDDHSPRITSPGRLSPDLTDDIMYMDDGSSSVTQLGEDGEETGDSHRVPTLTALGSAAMYSHKHSLQPHPRSVETTVPT